MLLRFPLREIVLISDIKQAFLNDEMRKKIVFTQDSYGLKIFLLKSCK